MPQILVTEVLQQRTQEYETKRTEYEEKLRNLTDQISSTRRDMRDLESYNRKIIDDVDTLTKEKIILQGRLQATMCQLQSKEENMKEQTDVLGIKDKERESEVGLLKKQIEEQSSMLKEYQDKVSALYLFKKYPRNSGFINVGHNNHRKNAEIVTAN